MDSDIKQISTRWRTNYRAVQEMVARKWMPEKERVFVAFNANIDTLHKLSEKRLEKIIAENGGNKIHSMAKKPPENITSKEDFLANLIYTIKTSSAREIACQNKKVAEWADENFPPKEERTGGQAGIMANYLAGLEIDVIAYTPLLSGKQASFFNSEVKYPSVKNRKLAIVAIKKASNSERTKINRIFEFKKGFKLGSTTSCRANRFILASRPKGTEPYFSKELEAYIPKMFQGVNRVILSGYQSEKACNLAHFRKARMQIRKIKKSNPKLLIHLEEAFVSDKGLEKDIVEYIAKNVDSIGMNEVEVRQIASCVLQKRTLEKYPKNTLEGLYALGVQIAKKLGLLRAHIHYLGFYIAIVNKKYPIQPENVRDALLYASLAAEARAKKGALPSRKDIFTQKLNDISEKGIQEIRALQKALHLCEGFLTTGICEMDGHYLIAVPTIISKHPKTTVGMGDVISSSAFAGEVV